MAKQQPASRRAAAGNPKPPKNSAHYKRPGPDTSAKDKPPKTGNAQGQIEKLKFPAGSTAPKGKGEDLTVRTRKAPKRVPK